MSAPFELFASQPSKTALSTRLGGSAARVAIDGLEAVQIASERPFDVILMDLQMPGLDGFEAAALVHGTSRTTPIIGVTASVGPETLAACLAAGMVGCLAKPLQLVALRAELSRVLPAARRAA